MPRLASDGEAADAVRELGNIAFTHAATALAALVHRRVDVSIPRVHVLEKGEAEKTLARADGLYIVSFRLSGDHEGILAVLFPQADAVALLEILCGGRVRGGIPDAEGEGTLREVGNIMAGSGLLALQRMLGGTVLHGTPELRRRGGVELAEADLFAGPLVLVLEAEFTLEERRARGTMVISPSDPGPLLGRLGVHAEAS